MRNNVNNMFWRPSARGCTISVVFCFSHGPWWGQLNQTLGSLAGHATKTRRLQSVAPTAACAAACDGIQCAFDDSQALSNQVNGGAKWHDHVAKTSEHVGTKWNHNIWSLSVVFLVFQGNTTPNSFDFIAAAPKRNKIQLGKARFSNLEGLCAMLLISVNCSVGMIWNCDSIVGFGHLGSIAPFYLFVFPSVSEWSVFYSFLCVGVCSTYSHVYISHHHIYTYHLHIASSHPHNFSSSHLHIYTYTRKAP